MRYERLEGNLSNIIVSERGEFYDELRDNKLKPFKVSSNNRYRINLVGKDGKTKVVFVAKLLAELFVPNPYCYHYVGYKDGDPSNFHVDNLEWHFDQYTSKESVEYKKDRSYNKHALICKVSECITKEDWLTAQQLARPLWNNPTERERAND